MLEHPSVYTLGRAATINHLLWNNTTSTTAETTSISSSSSSTSVSYESVAQSTDISTKALPGPDGSEVYRVERGGKVTYHGPGQLIIYPILNLREFKQDLHWYVTCIEEIIIQILQYYHIKGERSKGYPGVWVNDRKIAAVGMACSKWYTYHGLALNIYPNMNYFQKIIPCGIDDKEVTSLQLELERIAKQKNCTITEYLQQINRLPIHNNNNNPLNNNNNLLFPLTLEDIKPVALEAIKQVLQCDLISVDKGKSPI